MKIKNRLLAGVSALALGVATLTACHSHADDLNQTAVEANQDANVADANAQAASADDNVAAAQDNENNE